MTKPRSPEQEILLSALIGPLRYTIPIISYAVLYPLILKRFGLEVLGLWSLLATIITYLSLADAGFSALFTREMTQNNGPDLARKHGAEYQTAHLFYLLLTTLLFMGVLFSFPLWQGRCIYLPGITNPAFFLLDLTCLILTGTTVLASKIENSILVAQTQIVYTQLVTISTPVLLLILNIAGALLGHPIEGFAVGALCSSIVEYNLYHRQVLRILPGFRDALPPIGNPVAFRHHLGHLIRRGKYLYLSQLGGNLRDPLFRFILAGSFGLPSVAVFDVAFRLTRTVMDMATGGIVKSLFPVLARFHQNHQTDKTTDLMHSSFLALLVISTCGQGGVIMFGEPFYQLWLGSVPPHLMSATLALTGWLFLATLFIPFISLLNAYRHEGILAIGTWLHIVLSILLLPLAKFGNLSVPIVIGLWAVIGCLPILIGVTAVVIREPKTVSWLKRPAILGLTLAGFGILLLMTLGQQLKLSIPVRMLVWSASIFLYLIMTGRAMFMYELVPIIPWPSPTEFRNRLRVRKKTPPISPDDAPPLYHE